MNLWRKALEGSKRGTFEEKAAETKWCVCVFCFASGDFEARVNAVSNGWRTLKHKWICPKCMDVIRRSVQKGVG